MQPTEGLHQKKFRKLIAFFSFKVLAMFIGELEYGDMPFGACNVVNYLTFILFVYLVV